MRRPSLPSGDGGGKDEGIQEQTVAGPTPGPGNAAAQQQTTDDRAPLQDVPAEAQPVEPPAADDPGMVSSLFRAFVSCFVSHTAAVVAIMISPCPPCWPLWLNVDVRRLSGCCVCGWHAQRLCVALAAVAAQGAYRRRMVPVDEVRHAAQ